MSNSNGLRRINPSKDYIRERKKDKAWKASFRHCRRCGYKPVSKDCTLKKIIIIKRDNWHQGEDRERELHVTKMYPFFLMFYFDFIFVHFD